MLCQAVMKLFMFLKACCGFVSFFVFRIFHWFFFLDKICFRLLVFIALLGKSSRNLIGTLVFSGYPHGWHMYVSALSKVSSQSLWYLFFHFLFPISLQYSCSSSIDRSPHSWLGTVLKKDGDIRVTRPTEVHHLQLLRFRRGLASRREKCLESPTWQLNTVTCSRPGFSS